MSTTSMAIGGTIGQMSMAIRKSPVVARRCSHRWPTKVPTPGVVLDGGSFLLGGWGGEHPGRSHGGSRMCPGTGFFETPRLARGDHDDRVVEQAVEQRSRSAGDGQERAPVLERPVAGQADAAALVGTRHEPEQ